MNRGAFRFGIIGLFLFGLVVDTPQVFGKEDSAPIRRNPRAEAALERGYRPYLSYVERRIKMFWRPLQDHEHDRVVVRFRISQNGTVSKLKLQTSSGVETSDKNALQAMKIVSFAPPPTRAGADGSDNLDVEFAFEDTAPNGAGRASLLNSDGDVISSKPAPYDYGPYTADAMRRVKKNWYPPQGHEQEKVTVAFNVDKDGSVSNLRIERSTGVALSDEMALRAVKLSTFLRPPAESDVDLTLTLDKPLAQNIGRE